MDEEAKGADAMLPPRRPVDPIAQKRALGVVQQALFGSRAGPMKIGRYELSGALGSGAHGTVYRARDPELGREVAVKLLRVRGVETSAAAAVSRRLAAEARALARVEHPNVVTVFDVGSDEGQAFLVTELIRGQTLAAWLQEQPPALRILAVFADAAAGLAAAHARGLVHGDFKLENVMVDETGRARVLDFGIAHVLDRASAALRVGTAREGTPIYMAPEQDEGQRGDARSDQYAFCIALARALTGRFPFSGVTDDELAAAKRRPRLAGLGLPEDLTRALSRGLAVEPSARFDDMHALVAALTDVRPSNAPLLAAGLAVIAIAVPMTLAVVLVAPTSPEVAVGGSFVRGEVEVRLQHARALQASRSIEEATDAFEAAYHHAIRGGFPDRAAEAAVELVQLGSDRGQPDEALAWVRHAQALIESAAPDAPIRAGLASRRAVALATAGQLDAAIAAHREATDRFERQGPYAARSAWRLFSVSLSRAGRLREADDAARVALEQAQGALGEASPRVGPYLDLAAGTALELGDLVEAERLLGEAGPRIAEAIGKDHPLAAQHHTYVGTLRLNQGRLREAEARYREALGILERELGSEHPAVVGASTNLGAVLQLQGRFDESYDLHLHALRLVESIVGPEHADLVPTLEHLGHFEFMRGRPDEAFAYYQRALEILERHRGPRSPELVTLLNHMGYVERRRGRAAEAEAYHRRALALPGLADRHPRVIDARIELSSDLRELGRRDEARTMLARARQEALALYGSESRQLIPVWIELAWLERADGELSAARRLHRRAADLAQAGVAADIRDDLEQLAKAVQ